VITDVPAFMNGVAGTLSWASILQAIQSVVDNLPADE
jgi:hypothetical protein